MSWFYKKVENQYGDIRTVFNGKRIVLAVVLLVVGLILFFGSWGTVPTGHRGVKVRFNAVTGQTVQEGFYVKLPLIEDVKLINVQTQKKEVVADSASKDLQTVTATIALNYNVDPNKVVNLYQKTGIDYSDKVIVPSLEEAVKSVTAGYTAEQLITLRSEVNGKVYESIRDELKAYDVSVQQLNIVNFNFSESFNKAIEEKVTAEQNALAAKNKLQQVQFEAEQKVAESKGKAQAIAIESQALRDNPAVLELRALEKWDGVLPKVTSGVTPFINVD